jgi:ParB/RepB/Spo0J family partition protein
MNTSQLFGGATDAGTSDLDYLLAGGAEDSADRARERGLPVRYLPVEAVAPDPHQLRRLPHPSELLRRESAGDTAVTALLSGLRGLGQSIRDHGQLQPTIVYADTDPHDPAITHRLLHGQRRWTAATLIGIPTIWAVEVPRPSETARLQRQFDENEQREEFTDIERAWAIIALREALTAERGHEAPWPEVEARLRLSDSRRRDLLRLLRLSDTGQTIALHQRWSEWTLRPLHMAISAGDIDPDTATELLQNLASMGQDVTAPMVATAVAAQQEQQAARSKLRQELPPFGAEAARGDPDPSPLVARLRKVRLNLEQISTQAQNGIDEATRESLISEASTLMHSLEQLVHILGKQG